MILLDCVLDQVHNLDADEWCLELLAELTNRKGWQVWPNVERWSFQYHSASPYYQSQLGTNWWNSTQILNKIQSVNTERKPFKGCRSRNICFFLDQIVIFLFSQPMLTYHGNIIYVFFSICLCRIERWPWMMHIRRLQSDLETNKDFVGIWKTNSLLCKHLRRWDYIEEKGI